MKINKNEINHTRNISFFDDIAVKPTNLYQRTTKSISLHSKREK